MERCVRLRDIAAPPRRKELRKNNDSAAALGKRVRESRPDAPGAWRDVIGVVRDVHEDGVSLDASSRRRRSRW